MTNNDAYWCGTLSQAIREASKAFADGDYTRGRRYLNEALADYEVNSGFPPPDAKIIANVGHEMPLDLLKPGERLINGNVYYSERWLNDEILSRPAITAEAS